MYGLYKLQYMIERKNPSIVINEETGGLEAGATYDISSNDKFMMAFAAENYLTEEPKSDPRYLRWVFKFQKKSSDGTNIIDHYAMHPCTDEEFAKFEPTDTSFAFEKA